MGDVEGVASALSKNLGAVVVLFIIAGIMTQGARALFSFFFWGEARVTKMVTTVLASQEVRKLITEIASDANRGAIDEMRVRDTERAEAVRRAHGRIDELHALLVRAPGGKP